MHGQRRPQGSPTRAHESARESRPCAGQPVSLFALTRQYPKTAKVGGSSGGVPPLLRAPARPAGRVQSQARRRSTAATCASARSSRFGGCGLSRWRVEPWCTWLHCCLTPRSRGDPARRGALGPRSAVAGSIVLRGPKAPRLAGRLSSNVRPQIDPSLVRQGRRRHACSHSHSLGRRSVPRAHARSVRVGGRRLHLDR
jgi:hypothetical protein